MRLHTFALNAATLGDMTYMRRTIDTELDDLFKDVAAIAIDGPKAVGKSTTALERVNSSLHLDDLAVREVVSADPKYVLSTTRPVLIDEWQRVPEVWDVVRREIDREHLGGQFLLTGSATPSDGSTAHSGAGRIGRMRMRPMTLEERQLVTTTVSLGDLLAGKTTVISGETGFGLSDYVHEIVASGFPALRGLSDRALRFQLDSYLRNVVDRDVAEMGINVRKPDNMLAWLTAYGAASSTMTSYSQIIEAATPGQKDKPAQATTANYRDVLTNLWLLDPVPAWLPSGTVLNRLGKSPKHQLADPALAVRLMGMTVDSLLGGAVTPFGGQERSMLGPLFESLATLCVRVLAQAHETKVRHMRTQNGDREIDLVLERPDGSILAIEVKLAGTVSDSDVRHLLWLKDKLGPRVIGTVVINTGPIAFRRKDGVAVVPLALLGL